MNRENIFRGVKFTLAALLAILIAAALDLKYSTTAGIITILSIQNTKRETLKTAGRRGLALLCALLLAKICFGIAGFNVWAFAVYLLLFSTLCIYFKWTDAIAMNSVLVTHFLAEGTMSTAVVLNEIGIFIVGIGTGIIANIHLRRREEEFNYQADGVDSEIKGILRRMSRWIVREDKEEYKDGCFEKLSSQIEKAKHKAYENWNNTFFRVSMYEIAYIEMREKQTDILKHMYLSIKMLRFIPAQAEKVAGIIAEVENEYHKNNPVDGLIIELEHLFTEMKMEELPRDREEFEARAVLFYIMKQLQELLEIKREFKKEYRNDV